MNTYLIELLNSNSRLIIPDFGAFIVKQKHPRIVVFNEFLRYNDGLLTEYVASKENIDKNVAKEKVTEFINDIKEKLNKGKEVIIHGLGKLVKDNTGKILMLEENEVFEKKVSAESTLDIENENKPVVTAEKKEPSKTATRQVKTKNTVEKEKPIVKKDVEFEISDQKKGEEKIKPEIKPDIEKEKKEEPVKIEETPKTEIKKEIKEKEIIVTPVQPEIKETVTLKRPEPVTQVVQQHVNKKNDKNNVHYVLWIIFILLINGLILGWFVFDDRISQIFKKNTKTETTVKTEKVIEKEPITEQVNNEKNIIEEKIPIVKDEINEDKNPVTNTETKNITTDKKYFIVAGCFKDLNNANDMVKKLKTKGYDSERFGKIGNLHAVSYGTFLDKNAANIKLKEIRNKEQAEAWIIYY